MIEHLADGVIAAGDAPDPQPGSTAGVEGRQHRAGRGRASRMAAGLLRGIASTWSPTTRRLVGTMAIGPVVLVAGTLAGCTPSPGGTASVTSESGLPWMRFDAGSGRNNSITVSQLGGGWGFSSLQLTDSGSPVTPGSGCTRVNDNTVQCSIVYGQVIHLGDGNDTFASSAALGETLVDAGAGDDVVTGGPSRNEIDAGDGNDTVNGGASGNEIDAGTGNDTVIGGAAQDVVRAGAGNDTVNGGGGDDVLYEDSDALDVDSFSGGTGRDVVHYIGVLHGVNISLNDIADDGRPGEGDNVKSDIEDIRGTGFADTLTGNRDANSIWSVDISELGTVETPGAGIVVNGGGGDDDIWGSASAASGDRLSGGTGNDTIIGWAGDDVLSGGAGDDILRGFDGVDALDGGSESDYCDVGPAYQTDDVAGGTAVNCETGPSSK